MLWAYDGWEDVSLVGGEVKDGRRTLPRAIIIGTVAVIAIYALANLAYLSVLDVETIRHSRLVAADVAFKVIGSPGVVFVAVTVMLSTFGTLNGSIMTAPRIFFAMADDRLLFKQIAAVHPRYQTPYVAIVLNAAIGVAFVLTRGFEQLADQFVIAIVPFLALAVGAVFVLRRRAGLRHVVSRAGLSRRAADLHRVDGRAAAERADRQVESRRDARRLPRHRARAFRSTRSSRDAWVRRADSSRDESVAVNS